MLLNSIIVCIIVIIIIYFTKKQTFDYFTTVTKCTDELEIINIKKSESPKILILSGIHGNEYAPPIGVKEFIEEQQGFFKKGNLFFIPTIKEMISFLKTAIMLIKVPKCVATSKALP